MPYEDGIGSVSIHITNPQIQIYEFDTIICNFYYFYILHIIFRLSLINYGITVIMQVTY